MVCASLRVIKKMHFYKCLSGGTFAHVVYSIRVNMMKRMTLGCSQCIANAESMTWAQTLIAVVLWINPAEEEDFSHRFNFSGLQ